MKQGEVWVDSYKNQGDQNKDRSYQVLEPSTKNTQILESRAFAAV